MQNRSETGKENFELNRSSFTRTIIWFGENYGFLTIRLKQIVELLHNSNLKIERLAQEGEGPFKSGTNRKLCKNFGENFKW